MQTCLLAMALLIASPESDCQGDAPAARYNVSDGPSWLWLRGYCTAKRCKACRKPHPALDGWSFCERCTDQDAGELAPTLRARLKVERRQRVARGEVVPFYVCVYRIHRCYGGPQEGGWYYDALEIEKVEKVWPHNAKERVKALREEYPQPRYNRFSVLGNEGDVYIDLLYTLDELPEETTERPRYELAREALENQGPGLEALEVTDMHPDLTAYLNAALTALALWKEAVALVTDRSVPHARAIEAWEKAMQATEETYALRRAARRVPGAFPTLAEEAASEAGKAYWQGVKAQSDAQKLERENAGYMAHRERAAERGEARYIAGVS